MTTKTTSQPVFTETIKPSLKNYIIGSHLSLYSDGKLLLLDSAASIILVLYSLPSFAEPFIPQLSRILITIPFAMFFVFAATEAVIFFSLLLMIVTRLHINRTINIELYPTYMRTKRDTYDITLPYSTLQKIRRIGSYLFLVCKGMQKSFIPLSQVKNPEKFVAYLQERVISNKK